MSAKAYQWSLFSLLCFALMGSVGCAGIPAHEYAEFTPLDSSQRQMNKIKMTWEVREDAAEFCKQRQLDKGVSVQGTHIACAVWSVQRQECRIVTGKLVSHVVLGHEMRHCFEGHFHP
jgi:hypothetical protein